jgi:hypothetical protein
MALPIEIIKDDKYGVNGPFRVYSVPEGQGLGEYAIEDFRQPIDFDGNHKPLVYLQLTKNPMTKKFVPYSIYYDATQYTDEMIFAIPTLGEVGQKCSYCQARNDASKALAIPESTSAEPTTFEKVAQTVRNVQRPIGEESNQYMDLGNVVTPSFVSAGIDVLSKVFCEPLGEALLKIGMAGLTSIAAGWASEGGTQAAWRKISEDLVRDYKICPTDVPKIQQNVVAMKDALMKDRGNIIGAVSAGAFKNFGKIAKEHGFEVSAQGQFAAKGAVSVAPMQRGPGRAID